MDPGDENDGTAPALVIGAIAGIVATTAMTIAAAALFRRLPSTERYPLPPREITDQVSLKVLGTRLQEPAALAATFIDHFAFGAVAGALYWAPFPSRDRSLASSVGYAFAVWSVSYFGWVPAFGLLRPAHEHPPRRSILMIAAHAVWGSVLWASGKLLAASLGPLRDGPSLDARGPASASMGGELE
jgi:hypothetical protein